MDFNETRKLAQGLTLHWTFLCLYGLSAKLPPESTALKDNFSFEHAVFIDVLHRQGVSDGDIVQRVLQEFPKVYTQLQHGKEKTIKAAVTGRVWPYTHQRMPRSKLVSFLTNQYSNRP